MATKKLFLLFSILISMVETKALAYDIAVENADGVTIYYNYINGATELEVTYKTISSNSYSGSVNIPEEVTILKRTRKVTSIGEGAFCHCPGLTSVTIPNSVISIRENAFQLCSGLTSVTIPNSVISIGNYAFCSCPGLTSVTIPNSVTSIGDAAFADCSSLESVSIPNSVTSIGAAAFSRCSGLTSVTIPNSVISIRENAFQFCSGLTSVKIGNGVTSIGDYAFYGCTGLTTISIPNSVMSIGEGAFCHCPGLTSVTIPNSVTSIGDYAFYGCDIPEVISKIENPFTIMTNTFSENTFYNATLYVPVGTIEKYKATEGWKKFVYIEDEEPQKCETPTITYINGSLEFDCETEGVKYTYEIIDSDVKKGNAKKVDLTVTYNISVYATKDGYVDSDVATATLCWIEAEPKTEGIGEDAVMEVKAMPVLIQCIDGSISITGAPDDAPIIVYDTSGRQIGVSKALNGTAKIKIPQTESLAIVKIGDKAVKVSLK